MKKIAVAALTGLVLSGALILPGADEPTTPGWDTLGNLLQARNYATALTLPTGDVLIVGGVDPASPSVTRPNSELFDPQTGRSRLTSGRQIGRINHTATVGWGERVVVVGGTEWRDGHWVPLDRTDVYLPYADEWLRAAPMAQRRADHGAAALRDGRILVAGGNDGPKLLNSTEIYDPSSGTWSKAAPLPRVRTQFTMNTLPDGRVLAAGGLEERGLPSHTSLIYDPVRDAWSAGPDLSTDRVLHATVQLPSGDVLLIGGQRAASNTSERYDLRTGAFVAAGTLVDPRMSAQAVALADGRVIVSGGLLVSPIRQGFIPTARTELWDPATAMWESLPDAPSGRARGVLLSTPFGVLQIGGARDDEVASPAVERLVWKRAGAG